MPSSVCRLIALRICPPNLKLIFLVLSVCVSECVCVCVCACGEGARARIRHATTWLLFAEKIFLILQRLLCNKYRALISFQIMSTEQWNIRFLSAEYSYSWIIVSGATTSSVLAKCIFIAINSEFIIFPNMIKITARL